MKAATAFKKGDAGMKSVVEDCRAAMNTFVAYYRRNNKVAGAASFSTLYTAISTLSGHFQNYGAEYPVPEKRKKVSSVPLLRGLPEKHILLSATCTHSLAVPCDVRDGGTSTVLLTVKSSAAPRTAVRGD
jgi:hypothetical protein